MKFEYSCFISYRHAEGELMQTFITQLQQALESYIEPWLNEPLFIDDSRLQGGDILDPNLAEALCKCVCMILVFIPKYFDANHLYCTREFLAMSQIEKKRFEAAQIPPIQQQRSFIIPIIFRGNFDNMPAEVQKEGRIPYDFSKYTLVEPDIGNNAAYVDKIDQIAERIHSLYQEFGPYDDPECDELPSEADARAWLEGAGLSPRPARPRSPLR